MDQGKRANPWKTQVDGHKSTQENDGVYSEYTRIYVKYDLKIKWYLFIIIYIYTGHPYYIISIFDITFHPISRHGHIAFIHAQV